MVENPAATSTTTGTLVRVIRQGQEIWAVAIPDEQAAVEKVRNLVGPRDIVEASGELTRADVAQHGLAPGQAKNISL
jgi:hypothetical protein